jgi:lambda repressor-like predicted transcriptional regulator
MHPAHVIATLKECRTSAAQVARELRVTGSAVHLVIHGRTKSCRIARRICEITGLDPDALWPGRYPEFHLNAIGKPLPKMKEAA